MPRGHLTTEQRLRQANARLKNENATLRSEKAVLVQENTLLKQKLEDKESQRKTLLEKLYKPNKKPGSQKLGKKNGAQGYHRPQPLDADVTEATTFSLTQCPYCKQKEGLCAKPYETRIAYAEDIVICPEKVVKKYTIPKHWCSNCKEYVRSDKVPPIERIGPNVMAYVLYARYRLRLPFNKIQQSLSDLHNFSLSEGEISNQLTKAQELFKDDYTAIIALIKHADTVYADETGWRVRGKNFWIWVFVTKKGIRYVIEDTRGKGVAQNALGENPDRVLISDFYAAYKNIPGENQYCWVHLLRDAKHADELFFADLHTIYTQITQELTQEVHRRKPKRLDKLLDDSATKTYKSTNAQVVQRLQKRITKTKKELLTCLSYTNVLPENNTAERALRNNVVMRKIFGCSRSVTSAKTMEVNTSVIDTALMQRPDSGFFEVMLPKIKELRGEE